MFIIEDIIFLPGKKNTDSEINKKMIKYLNSEELEAGLDEIRNSPKNEGVLHLIVRRPATEEREVIQEGHLDETEGLVGDNWKTRGSPHTPDGSSHPDQQINIMNARAIALLSPDKDRWKLAGDQLYIDLDLSGENLPPGTRLKVGTAIIEITSRPHNGCDKFSKRFGIEAVKFVNSPIGKELHLRGVNAKVIQSGIARTGDLVSKM
jgi:hypothetical protein